MPQDSAIRLHNVSKFYKLYDKQTDRVREAIHPFRKLYHKKFVALDDVSIEIKKGESVGIIGDNGAGKSTLLKLISGVLSPSGGQIDIRGHVSALLELGAGFNPEFTGLQNIHFYGTISGLSKHELKRNADEICEFAELGEFINQPIKTYSSGMKARLGFSTAISIAPDILILDEVLAVGDFSFRQKCLAKVNEMKKDMAIILVSHSMNSIRLFCDRGILIDSGAISFDGTSDECVNYYIGQKSNNSSKPKIDDSIFGEYIHNKNKILSTKFVWNKESYKVGETMIFNFEISLNSPTQNLVIGIPVWDSQGRLITALNSDFDGFRFDSTGRKVTGQVVLTCCFNPGIYSTVLAIVSNAEYLYRQPGPPMTVRELSRVSGLMTPMQDWEFNEQ